MEADDSLVSLAGTTNPHGTVFTPTNPNPNPVGLGIHPRFAPLHLPEHDGSFESAEGEWQEGASPARSAGIKEEDEIGEEESEGSETLSMISNREEDPEGWARRLDELAGVLEVGEEEARAMRWGPAMGRERDAPDLSMEDFRALIDHHLTTTEWQYTSRSKLFPSLPGRDVSSAPFFGEGAIGDIGELHPIKIIGTSWTSRHVGRLERGMAELRAEGVHTGNQEGYARGDIENGMTAAGR